MCEIVFWSEGGSLDFFRFLRVYVDTESGRFEVSLWFFFSEGVGRI